MRTGRSDRPHATDGNRRARGAGAGRGATASGVVEVWALGLAGILRGHAVRRKGGRGRLGTRGSRTASGAQAAREGGDGLGRRAAGGSLLRIAGWRSAGAWRPRLRGGEGRTGRARLRGGNGGHGSPGAAAASCAQRRDRSDRGLSTTGGSAPRGGSAQRGGLSTIGGSAQPGPWSNRGGLGATWTGSERRAGSERQGAGSERQRMAIRGWVRGRVASRRSAADS